MSKTGPKWVISRYDYGVLDQPCLPILDFDKLWYILYKLTHIKMLKYRIHMTKNMVDILPMHQKDTLVNMHLFMRAGIPFVCKRISFK